MTTGKAFLVVGPESSGTRLLTRILMSFGCEGDGVHDQRWDKVLPSPNQYPLVVKRYSVPHGCDQWIDLPHENLVWNRAGYDIFLVLIFRNWIATLESQARAGYGGGTPEGARQNLRHAWIHISTLLSKYGAYLPFLVVAYESLFNPLAIRALARELQLRYSPLEEEIRDGNQKYWEGLLS